MTRPRRTERTWGNVAALCAKPAEVCAFGRFTSRSSHRCYSRQAWRNREIIFAAPSRGRAREDTTHTLENVRICERKERRITYVVKKMCLEHTKGIIIQFRDFPNVRITFANNMRTANTRHSRTAHAPIRCASNTRTCERLRTDRERKRKQGSPAPKGKTPLSFTPSARRTRRHGRRTPCGTCRSRRASRRSA